MLARGTFAGQPVGLQVEGNVCFQTCSQSPGLCLILPAPRVMDAGRVAYLAFFQSLSQADHVITAAPLGVSSSLSLQSFQGRADLCPHHGSRC